jgi:ADP-heptose:LPS heptosyltransferase
MKGWACIARLGGIGDNLVAASPLRPLKRLGYMTEVITSAMAASVFNNNPFVDKLSVKQEGELPGGDMWQTWFATRSGEYDLLVNLSNSMETRHALHRGTTGFWWPQDYRRKMCAGSYLETAHDIVGVPHEFGPLFFPTEEEVDRAMETRDNQIGGPYLTWVIAGSRVDKAYPYAPHAICRIISELKIPVVLVGTGPLQFQMAKAVHEEVVRSNSTEKGLHLALSPEGADPGGLQHWSQRRSITQAWLSDCVITPDTGVGWAVAMERMPKVALMSHASDENITKHWVNTISLKADQNRVPCWPCHRLHDDIGTCTPSKDNPQAAACMADISVQSILDAVRKSWNPAVRVAVKPGEDLYVS